MVRKARTPAIVWISLIVFVLLHGTSSAEESILEEAAVLKREITLARERLEQLEVRLDALISRSQAVPGSLRKSSETEVPLEDATSQPREIQPPATGIPTPASRFEHRPAIRQFTGLSNDSFLTGYVTGVFADFGPDFPGDLTPPGQLLVPATGNSSFAYDWALILRTAVSDRLDLLVETHFVSSPSGDFAPEIVVTEANASWMPWGRDPLRITMGMYWLPFGVVNDDWYSASNLFALVPVAAEAFPLHYNERGIKLEGQFALGSGYGLNYALSVGNGVRGFGVDDQKSRDFDNNKALVGRVGFFPDVDGLEIGFSAMTAELRDAGDPLAGFDDVDRYPAELEATAIDLVYRRRDLKLRGYWIGSTERLLGAPDLDRRGAMLEAVYTAWQGDGLIQALEPKIRLDWSEREVLFPRRGTNVPSSGTLEDRVLGLGLDIWLSATSLLRFDYFIQDELDDRELDNDGFALRFSGVF